MSKIIAIHQPETFPWAGYLNKMLNADEFIILDDVQYKKNNFQNRNRIIMNGKPTWLTLPIDTKGRLESTIADTRIAYTVDWKSRLKHLLEVAYSKSLYYKDIMPELETIINQADESLLVFNMHIIAFLRYYLGITTPIIYSSKLNITSHKTDLVFDICKECGATTYLSGEGGRNYLELDKFNEADIEVLYQSFDSTLRYNNMTEPYMSVIDIIMNNSREDSLDYIKDAFSFVK